MELKQNVIQLNQKVSKTLSSCGSERGGKEKVSSTYTLCENFFQLENSIKKIEHLESCDCKKSCSINGSLSREDGEKWDSGCDECQCKSGVVTCIRKKCKAPTCKNPVLDEGECCPKCLSEYLAATQPWLSFMARLSPPVETCYLNSKDYDHGEKHISGCNNCTCIDGSIKCVNIECPKLTCPEDKQIPVADECCKYCHGDYCPTPFKAVLFSVSRARG
jgi:protein kinase C-binding protein NELL